MRLTLPKAHKFWMTNLSVTDLMQGKIDAAGARM
jgi:hypothetical protein